MLRLFASVRQLPERLRPAHITRTDDGTLIALDPRDSRADLALYLLDNLSAEEVNGYRAAWGEPPVGQPLRPHLTDSALTMRVTDIPWCLLTSQGKRDLAAALLSETAETG